MDLKYKVGISILAVGVIAIIGYFVYKSSISSNSPKVSPDTLKTSANTANTADNTANTANTDANANTANTNVNETISNQLAAEKTKIQLYEYGIGSWVPAD